MEDQVPFKVYMFWKENDKPEVRRFGVEKTVVTSFHYLNAKIQDVYPGLRGKAYSVAWKDEEGDDVVISSDEEVMTALQALGGDVIKLFVYCKGGDVKDEGVNIVITATTDNANAASSGTMHYGVFCDSCNEQVVGFRYKCTTCDDFDLCARCEAAGRHPDHCMVRVPTPTMPRTIIKAAIKRSRHFLKTVASAAEDCPYKKHRRDRSTERRHRDHGTQGAEDSTHRDHRRHRNRVSWLDTFATYMNEFANLAGDIDLDPTPQEPQTQNKEAKPEDTQEKQKTTTQSNEAPKTSAAQTQSPFNVEQLKGLLNTYLGNNTNTESTQTHDNPRASTSAQTTVDVVNIEQITGLLKYLGKDLAAFLPQTPNADVSASSSQAGEDVEMGQGDRSTDRKASNASSVTVKTEVSDSNDKRNERENSFERCDDWTVINKEKDLMDATASAPPDPVAPIGFNLPEEFQERVKISEGGLYPPLHTATAVLNPKELEEAAAAAHSQATTQAAQAKAQTAQATAQAAESTAQAAQATTQATAQAQNPATAPPQSQPRQRHPKAHIDAAIQHMLAMGFTNEGGWLTQLLESKDGNIAAVLDLLTPVNPRK